MNFWTYWLSFAITSVIIFHVFVILISNISVIKISLSPFRIQFSKHLRSNALMYWASLVISFFITFQFLGYSFSANPQLYVFKVPKSRLSEKIVDINHRLELLAESFRNIENITIGQIKSLSNETKATAKESFDLMSELNADFIYSKKRVISQAEGYQKSKKKYEEEMGKLRLFIEKFDKDKIKAMKDGREALEGEAGFGGRVLSVLGGLLIGIIGSVVAGLLLKKKIILKLQSLVNNNT